MMNNRVKALYIHIPFCKTICTYCDFCKFYYHKPWINGYLESLKQELKMRYQGEALDTIYIGGGTPNCLDLTELQTLFDIIKKVKKNKTFEFTIECNIEYITKEQLLLFKKNGVNRLSIGIQTFNDSFINFLGRHHNHLMVIEKINLVKEYFININIDLIYGIPNQTLADLQMDIELFLNFDIPHLSTYSLLIEPQTILYNNKTANIDEELDAMMYALIKESLQEKGYEHYEISNFAKEKYQSKHNLTYWHNGEYYGIGLGASGYINSIRYDNTKTLNEYLKQNCESNKTVIDFNTKVENEFILGLRIIKGINKQYFYDKYNININDIDVVKGLIAKNKLVDDQNNIFINLEHLYLSNEILIEFLGVDYEKYSI